MIILPQQKMDLLKCLISVEAMCMAAEPLITATQDTFFGETQPGTDSMDHLTSIDQVSMFGGQNLNTSSCHIKLICH